MCEATDSATSIALYADDTKIWREINNWQDHEMLQSDINALLQWSIVNKMKFHPQKCKVVPIGYSYTHKEMVDYFEKNFPVQPYSEFVIFSDEKPIFWSLSFFSLIFP